MRWRFGAGRDEPVSYWVIVGGAPNLSNNITEAESNGNRGQIFTTEKTALKHLEQLRKLDDCQQLAAVKCAREADAERFLSGELWVDVENYSSKHFYAVYVSQSGGEDCVELDNERIDGGVFGSKSSADKHMKKFKKFNPRFQIFSNFLDAEHYSLTGELPGAPGTPSKLKQPYGLRDSATNGGASGQEEQPLPYKMPPRADLLKLRVAIEKNDLQTARELVSQNPCFLVNSSSGDSPTLLHEGPRYNAMIIAARSGSLDCAVFVLETVSNPAFLGRLYVDDSPDFIESRIGVLREAYINTPDKMRFRTPLHWTVAKGNVDFAQFLLAQPEIHPGATDASRQTILHVALDGRVASLFQYLVSEPKMKEVVDTDRESLAAMIRDLYSTCESEKEKYLKILNGDACIATRSNSFVALFRDFDYSQPPIIQKFEREPPLVKTNDSYEQKLNGSPSFFLAAVIGPCSAVVAAEIEKEWMRSSRSAEGRSLKLSDIHKGMERIGRGLAAGRNLQWNEYWPFMGPSPLSPPTSPSAWVCGKYADLSTPEGLSALESHLRRSSRQSSASGQIANTFPKSRHIRMSTMGSPYAPSLLSRPSAWSRESQGGRNRSFLTSKRLNFAEPTGSSVDVEEPGHCDKKLKFDWAENNVNEPPDNFEDSRSDFSDYENDDEDCDTAESCDEVEPKKCDTVQEQPGSSKECDDSSTVLEAINRTDGLQLESGDEAEGTTMSSSDESFETPPASPQNAEFMMGQKPSKVDEDVLAAIKSAPVDRAQFPLVHRWQTNVEFFSQPERKKWPGPDSVRFNES